MSDKELDDLNELPKGWCWIRNENYTFEVKDGTHDTPKYHDGGIPFITQKNIRETGFEFKNIKYISIDDHTKFYKRSNVEQDDILISMIGHNRGMSCIVDINKIFSIKNVGLVKLFNNIQSKEYILFYYQSKTGQDIILNKSKGGAQPFIGLTELRNWPIPICPIEEQKEIVRRVEALFTVADQFEDKLEAARSRVEKLTSSILSKAFRGELVSQNPNEESAERLLERIRAERETLTAKGGRRTKKKLSGREKKPKHVTVESVDLPEPVAPTKTDETKETIQQITPNKKTSVISGNRFDPSDVLKALRKVVFHHNEIDEYALLRLVGKRIGAHRLSDSIRQELEAYIKIAIRRKIILRNNNSYHPATPTINHYDDEYLIKVLRFTIKSKKYLYQRDSLVDEVAQYLGFDRVSDAFKERMKSTFRKAIQQGLLYRDGNYVGKP